MFLLITLALLFGLFFMHAGFAPALYGFGAIFDIGFFLICLFIGFVIL